MLNKSPKSYTYATRIISCFQQLERYDDAEAFIKKTMRLNNSKALFVYLGYNYILKGEKTKAASTFKVCHESIIKNTNNVYVVARQFEQFGLTSEAITSYEIACTQTDNPNFIINLARLYGEQGNIDSMFNSYLDYIKIEEIQKI